MSTRIEVIPARNGKLEDKLVFGTIAFTLLSASALLYALYSYRVTEFSSIPKPIRASLTMLSNAGEEIQMIREIEQRIPTLNELMELNVQPFARVSLSTQARFVWTQTHLCFAGLTMIDDQAYFVRLRLPESQRSDPLYSESTTGTPEVFWSEQAHHHGDSSQALTSLCTNKHIRWNAGTTLLSSETKTN